jgi:hypothetical protein
MALSSSASSIGWVNRPTVAVRTPLLVAVGRLGDLAIGAFLVEGLI